MKKNIMKRAWEIRREAAKNHGCKVSEILMSDCLKMAWHEAKNPKKEVKMEKFASKNEIPGMAMVEQASLKKSEAWERYNMASSRGYNPDASKAAKLATDELSALIAQYPIAGAYLRAEDVLLSSSWSNTAKQNAAKEAMAKILNGEPIEQALSGIANY